MSLTFPKSLFGKTFVEQKVSGKYINPYKFNAKELDSETGLYYYGARYYNPRLSIWYGVDPLAEEFPSWSPYAYALQNPIRFTDPDGMAPQDQSEMDCCSILLQGAGRGITILGTGGSAGGAFTTGLATLPFVIAGVAYAGNVKQKEFLIQRGNEFSALSEKEQRGLLKESFSVTKKDNLIVRSFPANEKAKIYALFNLKPEAGYKGSGKHGLKWKEGGAEAKKTGIPQGQWGSQEDLDFAGQKASGLKPREGAEFELPTDTVISPFLGTFKSRVFD